MSQEYKIKAVKTGFKEWDSHYGPMKTYLIQVEDNGEPVQINKKADSPAPQIGDELYGDIVDSEYGQKFKGAKKPFTKAGYIPKDEAAIKAMWSISQAIQYMGEQADDETVEAAANRLFAMVDRVKTGSPDTEPENAPESNEKEKVRDWDNLAKKDKPVEELPEQINLDEIPF